ncbi:rhomboid family intramembrane serine protease [Sphingobium lignivorans]|uniref:Membrane associated rhomboid family serine protease n=1 Tax=Sphingobium lignivorans TaxID=2735886 RepID=A0ABR6NGC3_9SPHN|nr:rhomboid family intramembrane serine protease [Sphingobium lignivorans]MBB5986321.1 membrane associated rhomboid family serine protease [Sphingobium lignivorans]
MSVTLPRGPATNILAAITLLAFLPVQLAGETDRAAILAGFIPERVTALAAQNISLDIPWLPLWITPLSATLIHSGWLHLAFNLLMLVFCGRFVEQVLGQGRTVIAYLVGAYAAALGQWATSAFFMPAGDGVVPMIGASGAVSALLGTYAVIYSQRGVRSLGPIPAHVVRIVWLAVAWTILQLLIAFAGGFDSLFRGIAIGAHIGGFIAGLLLARPLLARRFRAAP